MKRFLALLMTMVMILGLFAGCGQKAEAPVAQAPAEAPAAETPEVKEVPVEEGQSYKEVIYTAYGGDLDTADPYGSTSGQSMFFTNMTFDTLTYVDPDSGEICPELATEWKDVNGDGKDWEIKLVDNATFHTGEPFTAEDVKFTWEYAANGAGNVVKSINAAKYVDSIEVVDATTVIFHLNTGMPDFASYLETKMYSKAAFDSMDAADAAVIGTGPYYYDKELTQTGVQFAATRYDAYWRGLDSYPSKSIVFKFIADENTQVAALINGELDFMFNVSAAAYNTLISSPGVEMLTRTGANSYYLGFNYARDFWTLDARKAFASAINKDDIVAIAFEGGIGGTANYNFCVPTGLGYAEVEALQYNPDAAADLEAAGLTGKTLTIAFYAACAKMAEVIQANLAPYGVDVQLRQVDSANWTSFKTAKEEYDIFLDYCAYQGALLYNFNRFFHSTGSSNAFGHNNPEYDELEAGVMNAGTWENMLVKFAELEQWAADNIPVFPLAYSTQLLATRENVGGVLMAPSNNYYDFSTVYVVE